MAFPAGNTYWAVKELIESGMSEEEAVAVVGTIEGFWPADLATKDDLVLLRSDLRNELENAVSRLEHYTLKWLFIAVTTALVIALAFAQIWPD